MSEQMQYESNVEKLILLVGSNPLPNYLVARALRPECVGLVYTKETEVAKDRLKSELQRVLGNSNIVDAFVQDATCALTVRRTIARLLAQGNQIGSFELNYTGGTKVMAAHARIAFAESGGMPEQSSYLDEGGKDVQPRLRYDNGRALSLEELCSPALELQTVLALHGINHRPRSSREGAPTQDDARKILCAVLQEPELAKKLYEERIRLETLRKPKVAVSEPFQPSAYGLDLSIRGLPESEQTNSRLYKSWYKFIGGEWLEEWIGTKIGELEMTPVPEVVVGVNAFRGENRANLEVDVAVVRGHRTYFVSCTTDDTKSRCKSKLFEVAVRSRQLGGDLARAALVCLADDKTVRELQQDINDLWGATNTTRVFGLSDLKTWSACEGQQPNLYALESWMES
ncbi:hypothetical protein DL240_15185 [Lujinxingia litoralis]|uniref:DUF1887 domain-containing protein n=1 Tax=Lujinxingia litoralis TaxID=2211119 RepID=A0A328C3Y7_9DELT|nr:hypothetical protein [Lujinxingia litoralis]RAL20659.1 hypothetical protein DL240_15185 [Lujinxingia litoralis]